MLNWIKSLFRGTAVTPIIEWRTDASIFNFLASNVGENGKLKNPEINLPDEEPVNENKVRFAAGLLDSMFGADDSEAAKMQIEELSQLIKQIAKHGDEVSETRFYQLVTATDSVIGIIDNFLEEAVSQSLPIEPHLIKFSKDLAFKSGHRNAVKFGIALCGVCADESTLDKIKILGLHDEFTLFAVAAICNLSPAVADDLWALAKKVDGWGKIRAVDFLSPRQLTDDMKYWLITEGYKNSIMYEYLAYTCAISGDLHQVIAQDTISDILFVSSTEIIEALIAGGPAEDITQYHYAASLIQNYIRHAATQVPVVSTFIVLNHIKEFLIPLHNDADEFAENGWTEDIIANCLIDVDIILKNEVWFGLTTSALKTVDSVAYWQAKQAAKILGIDIWDIVWQKLKDQPEDWSSWYDVVDNARPDQVDDMIELAIDVIPLEEITSGPQESLGQGPAFAAHRLLDNVLRLLEDYPKKGEELLLAALHSPVNSNRNMALRILSKWGNQNWSEAILARLANLCKIEPNDRTKINANRVLNSQELSD